MEPFMPFDVTLADAKSSGIIPERAVAALGFENPARSSDDLRLERIQRVVNVVAVFIFGILGVMAGAALVGLMLVTLIIPTTMGVALAFAAVTVIALAVLLWMKRRAVRQMHAPSDNVIGLAV
jgi:predicted lipid-binding transport protein (Tim44 family)